MDLAELFKELHYTVSVRLEMDSVLARATFQRTRATRTEAHRDSLLGHRTVDQRKGSIGRTRVYEKQYSWSLYEVF